MLISQDNLIEELRNKLSPIKNLISLQQLLKKGTPSMIVLRSFYVANVEKPDGVTLRMFDFLRAIADDVIKDYKAKLSAEKLRLENLHLN